MTLPPTTGSREDREVPTLIFDHLEFSHGDNLDMLVEKFRAATGIEFTKDEASNVFRFNQKASTEAVQKMSKIAHREAADLFVEGQDLVVSFSPSF